MVAALFHLNLSMPAGGPKQSWQNTRSLKDKKLPEQPEQEINLQAGLAEGGYSFLNEGEKKGQTRGRACPCKQPY